MQVSSRFFSRCVREEARLERWRVGRRVMRGGVISQNKLVQAATLVRHERLPHRPKLAPMV